MNMTRQTPALYAMKSIVWHKLSTKRRVATFSTTIVSTLTLKPTMAMACALRAARMYLMQT